MCNRLPTSRHIKRHRSTAITAEVPGHMKEGNEAATPGRKFARLAENEDILLSSVAPLNRSLRCPTALVTPDQMSMCSSRRHHCKPHWDPQTSHSTLEVPWQLSWLTLVPQYHLSDLTVLINLTLACKKHSPILQQESLQTEKQPLRCQL